MGPSRACARGGQDDFRPPRSTCRPCAYCFTVRPVVTLGRHPHLQTTKQQASERGSVRAMLQVLLYKTRLRSTRGGRLQQWPHSTSCLGPTRAGVGRPLLSGWHFDGTRFTFWRPLSAMLSAD